MSFGGQNLAGHQNQFEYSGQQSFRQHNNQGADMNSFGQYNNNTSQNYASSRSQEDIDVYLKEALKKEISLRFMLGIYKLHALEIKNTTSNIEKNFAFEKIKNIKLESTITNLQKEMQQQKQNNNNKTLILINSQQTANKLTRPNSNEEWEKQLEIREAALIEKMKAIKFEEKRVRDNQQQTHLKSEDMKGIQDNQNSNRDRMSEQYEQKFEDLIRRENNTKFLEEQLTNKINQYEEMIQDLKNQEQELEYRIKEIKFEPLNLLGSSELLKQKLSTMKKEIYDNFQSYTQNLPYLQDKFTKENNQFYALFQNWEENPKFLEKKSELLKNLEVHLLEERFKMEIVENYLKKEYEIVKNQKEDLQQLQEKHLMLQQYEENLKQESEFIQQKKNNLERQQQAFKKEQSIIQQYSNLTQNNQQQQGNITQISQHVQSLIQNEPNKNKNYSQIMQDIKDYSHLADKSEITFRGQDQDLKYSDEHGTIKSLEEENTYLRDELQDLKKRMNQYEQNEQNYIQEYSNNQNFNQFDQSNEEIQYLIKESKEKRLIIKFLELWIRASIKKGKGQNSHLKALYLYLWRLKQYDFSHFRKLDQIEYDVNGQQYLDFKWSQKAAQLQKQNRFPAKKLSKKRQEYEMAVLDFERKKFYQNRLAVLLNSILLRQRRAEKLMFVIAFHRFARNCFRLSCNIQRDPTSNNNQQQKQERISQNHIESSYNIEDVGKGAFNESMKWEKPRKRDKSPVMNAKNKSSSAMKALTTKQIEEKVAKEMQTVLQRKIRKQQAICLIYSLTMKKEIRQMHAVSKAFGQWRHLNIEAEKQLITRELNYVNYQIQERVFQDNLFKTKVKLQKTEIDSKLSLLNELLSSVHQSVNNN